jgi:hypothetical protein
LIRRADFKGIAASPIAWKSSSSGVDALSRQTFLRSTASRCLPTIRSLKVGELLLRFLSAAGTPTLASSAGVGILLQRFIETMKRF